MTNSKTNAKAICLIAAVVLLCTVAQAATAFTDSVALLARDIAGMTGPGAVAITVRNASALTSDQVTEIRRAIESQLRTAGIRTTTAGRAVAEVAITLSENAQGWLWIAEIKQGNDTRVVMRPVPRIKAEPAAAPQSRVTIRQTLLYSQAQPILDAAVFEPGTPNAQVAVLDADKVALYRSSTRALVESLPITNANNRPWPRDLRGRMLPGPPDHVWTLWLPGVECDAVTGKLACRDSDDPWPLDPLSAWLLNSRQPNTAFFGASRNFFTGVLQPGIGQQTNVPPFYSAAALPRGNYALWTMAGVDGRVREFDGVNDRVVTSATDWGSDLASVTTSCGPMLLVTGAGDRTVPDRLRAFEIPDREPVLASAPLELTGPVTALWSSLDGASATAVVHNLRTDEYEAYSVTLVCNQ